MTVLRPLIALALLGSSLLPVSLYAQSACEAETPNALLQWASPRNWVLLSLGGPTEVTVTDSLTVYPMTNQLIGIAPPGNLTVNGASMVRSDVLLNSAGTLNQSSPSYVRSVFQDEDADAYLYLAKRDALAAAQCASTLVATSDLRSVNIGDPSGNLTIQAEQRTNVVNLTDLIVTNGTLTLSSHFTKPDIAPTLIINISGIFRVEGPAKILLEGTLDELHVLFNVIGPGQDVVLSGTYGSDGLPTAQITGVLLVSMRNINLSGGLVNGTVIGAGRSIAITAGSQVVSHLQ